ncbi:Serine hydrolase-like protein 2 [Chamberlinius hualienensis]
MELIMEFLVLASACLINAKEWGSSSKRPILGIHGWQDNCGSLDRLISLLSYSDMHLVAIDLPGHGLSSHIPIGMLRSHFDYVVDIHRVIRFLGWKSFSFLAHSMGAAIALTYSGMYPSEVNRFVAVEAVHPEIPNPKTVERSLDGVKQLFDFEEKLKRKPRVYSKDEALTVMQNAFGNSMTKKSCETLFIRGVTEVEEGKYTFNRDLRLKIFYIPPLSSSTLNLFTENVKCDCLFIKAKDGFKINCVTDETLNILKKNAKSCEIVKVDGNHHVHLNNPERVADVINKFLLL